MKVLSRVIFNCCALIIILGLVSCDMVNTVRDNVNDPESGDYIVRSDLLVSQNATTVSPGSSVSFGIIPYDDTADRAFTLTNNSIDNLALTGSPCVDVNGTTFSVVSQPDSTLLAPGESTTFTLRFTPGTIGEKTGSISIELNSGESDAFVFSLDGDGQYQGYKTVETTGDAGRKNDIAVVGDNIYISSVDYSANTLSVVVSHDGGLNWITRDIDKSGYVGRYNSIAAIGDRVYISYYNSSAQGLMLAKSTDAGKNWTTEEVPEASAIDFGEYNSIVAAEEAEGDRIYITCYDSTNCKLLLYTYGYSSSTQTFVWSGTTIDSPDATYDTVGRECACCADETYVYIAYRAKLTGEYIYDLCFTRYKHGITPIRKVVAENTDCPFTGDVGIAPSIAVSGTDVYISYFNMVDNCFFEMEVLCARSGDGGNSWNQKITVDSAGMFAQGCSYTDITADGDTVYLSLNGCNYVTSYDPLQFGKSTDNGLTWSLAPIDDPGTGNYDCFNTNIYYSNGSVYISYASYDKTTADSNLKFARSVDGGTSWD